MDIAAGQESFRVRANRRISKALSRTSEHSSRIRRKTSAFAEQQIRRTSKFATEVDSGLNKMGIYDNRFEKRRSSRQLLMKEKETSITALMYLYSFRQKLQKVEFLIIWTFFFALIASLLIASQDVSDQIYPIAYIYIQYSVLTRFFAYIMDFTNAAVKLATSDDSKWSAIPLWLILHHSGVLGSHIMIAFFFMGPEATSDNFPKMLFGLVATQSSHNTWTKKYSLTLYWGNVLLGFVCLSCITDLSIRSTTARGRGTAILLCSVLATLCGVVLLANSAAKGTRAQSKPPRSKVPPITKPSFDIGTDYGSLNCIITEEEEREIGRVSGKMSII